MIRATVQGDQDVLVLFDQLDQSTVSRLRVRVASLLTRLQNRIKYYLTGVALHVRTGHLRASIGQELIERPDVLVARSGIFGGPTEGYGRAHEFGVDKLVTVKEHFRTQRLAFGRPIPVRQTLVRAHPRHMVLPERSFARAALNDLRGAITSELAEVVEGA